GMMSLEERRPNSYPNFIRSYAACAAFADYQVGRVLDALDSSSMKASTIIWLISDHGFHLGEKDHIEKFALWEKSNHIPMIVIAPNVSQGNKVCSAPVDATCVYPTLLELCELPMDGACDGRSIVPLLEDPAGEWETPALMTYGRGNHAVRSSRWRYIRYADGSEELYDHNVDALEWKNLADDPRYQQIKTEHQKWLPKEENSPISDLKKK
ncbi:MAG: sulfatase-like hydrolase/transferase, partial [Planctomycetota bacterium]